MAVTLLSVFSQTECAPAATGPITIAESEGKLTVEIAEEIEDEYGRERNDVRRHIGIAINEEKITDGENKETQTDETKQHENNYELEKQEDRQEESMPNVQRDETTQNNNTQKANTDETGETMCEDLDDETLEENLRRIRHPDYAFIRFPQHQLTHVAPGQRIRNERAAPNATCSALTQDQHSLGLKATSLCPWNWYLNTDEYRYPRIMNFAQCKCNACRGYGGNCELTWYNVRVLRHNNTCINGKRVYEPVLEPVPVACICNPILTTNFGNVPRETKKPMVEENSHEMTAEALVGHDFKLNTRLENGDDLDNDEVDSNDDDDDMPPRRRRSHNHRRRRHHHGKRRMSEFYAY